MYLHLWKPPYYIVDIAYCLLPFFVVGCMTPQKNQCGAGLPSHVCLVKPLRRPTTVNPGQMGDWSRPIITIFWGINIHLPAILGIFWVPFGYQAFDPEPNSKRSPWDQPLLAGWWNSPDSQGYPKPFRRESQGLRQQLLCCHTAPLPWRS